MQLPAPTLRLSKAWLAKAWLERCGRFASAPLVLLVKAYRYLVSPWLGANCRFAPSCSEYAIEALERHGVARGGLLAARRILRCHPCGGSGFDPVPRHVCAGSLSLSSRPVPGASGNPRP